jgi:two-component system phosphate regulon sensor histidine kinase PhoR
LNETVDYPRKIFLVFFGILLCFVLIMGALLSHLTKSSLDKVELDHLVRTSRIIHSELQSRNLNHIVDLDELCDQLSKRTSYLVYIINIEGERIAGFDVSGHDNFLSKSDVKKALELGFGSSSQSKEDGGVELGCSFKLNRDEGASPLIMRMVQSKFQSQPYLEDYREQSWAMAFVVLCGTAMIIWWSSVRFSKPLTQIQTLVKDLSVHQDQQFIEIQSYSKLGQMIQVLNEIFTKNREKLVTIIQQRNNHEAILSGMKEGLIALDSNGRISEINSSAEQLLDMRGIRKRGRSLGEILRSRKLIELQKRLTEKSEPFETEIVVHIGTSLERIFQVSGYVTEESIESHHSLMVFTDITRLRKLENMRQEFVANVSHELKTPLTSIRGYAETLKDMSDFASEIPQKFLLRIEQNADRLHHIIEDLMSLSRIEQNGLAKDDLEILSIKFIFDQLKREVSKDLLSRVEFNILTEKEEVVAHSLLLHQALFNLVDNALKYSGEGKRVKVTVKDHESEKGFWFEVSDNGQGIAKEHLPYLMDRFYRADKARSREKGGSGLGLSIVKHIAESHGGRVEIDSVLGEGSQFRLFLPEILLEEC